ncbi:hypothetical protein EAH72_03105 [Pseudomonas caspiana]|nr:hypothetical protein EAH72_03105 [Pseudomonas caspiana]
MASSKSRFSLGYVAFTATPSRLENGLQDDKERYRALPSRLNATAMSPNSIRSCTCITQLRHTS